MPGMIIPIIPRQIIDNKITDIIQTFFDRLRRKKPGRKNIKEIRKNCAAGTKNSSREGPIGEVSTTLLSEFSIAGERINILKIKIITNNNKTHDVLQIHFFFLKKENQLIKDNAKTNKNIPAVIIFASGKSVGY